MTESNTVIIFQNSQIMQKYRLNTLNFCNILMNNFYKSAAIISILFVPSAFSQTTPDSDKEIQDMSDPLAIYTQGGLGVSDKGANIKIGQTYEVSQPGVMAMNIIEVKGIGGGLFYIRDNKKPLYRNVDDSVNSFRFRNFQVKLAKGLGQQLDLSYDMDNDKLDASYSVIQALPKIGILQLFPLAGGGGNYCQ